MCCRGLLDGKFNRRHFVRAVAIGAATFGLVPHIALAAEGNYEAMILSCIDPRMQEPVHKYTVEQNLYRVPEIVTRGRFPDGGESDSTWRTQEARHVGSDTIAPGF